MKKLQFAIFVAAVSASYAASAIQRDLKTWQAYRAGLVKDQDEMRRFIRAFGTVNEKIKDGKYGDADAGKIMEDFEFQRIIQNP